MLENSAVYIGDLHISNFAIILVVVLLLSLILLLLIGIPTAIKITRR